MITHLLEISMEAKSEGEMLRLRVVFQSAVRKLTSKEQSFQDVEKIIKRG